MKALEKAEQSSKDGDRDSCLEGEEGADSAALAKVEVEEPKQELG